MKRWLCPTDPGHKTFWSVDEQGRFWLEDAGEYTPGEPPRELIHRHEAWVKDRF